MSRIEDVGFARLVAYEASSPSPTTTGAVASEATPWPWKLVPFIALGLMFGMAFVLDERQKNLKGLALKQPTLESQLRYADELAGAKDKRIGDEIAVETAVRMMGEGKQNEAVTIVYQRFLPRMRHIARTFSEEEGVGGGVSDVIDQAYMKSAAKLLEKIAAGDLSTSQFQTKMVQVMKTEATAIGRTKRGITETEYVPEAEVLATLPDHVVMGGRRLRIEHRFGEKTYETHIIDPETGADYVDPKTGKPWPVKVVGRPRVKIFREAAPVIGEEGEAYETSEGGFGEGLENRFEDVLVQGSALDDAILKLKNRGVPPRHIEMYLQYHLADDKKKAITDAANREGALVQVEGKLLEERVKKILAYVDHELQADDRTYSLTRDALEDLRQQKIASIGYKKQIEAYEKDARELEARGETAKAAKFRKEAQRLEKLRGQIVEDVYEKVGTEEEVERAEGIIQKTFMTPKKTLLADPRQTLQNRFAAARERVVQATKKTPEIREKSLDKLAELEDAVSNELARLTQIGKTLDDARLLQSLNEGGEGPLPLWEAAIRTELTQKLMAPGVAMSIEALEERKRESLAKIPRLDAKIRELRKKSSEPSSEELEAAMRLPTRATYDVIRSEAIQKATRSDLEKLAEATAGKIGSKREREERKAIDKLAAEIRVAYRLDLDAQRAKEELDAEADAFVRSGEASPEKVEELKKLSDAFEDVHHRSQGALRRLFETRDMLESEGYQKLESEAVERVIFEEGIPRAAATRLLGSGPGLAKVG